MPRRWTSASAARGSPRRHRRRDLREPLGRRLNWSARWERRFRAAVVARRPPVAIGRTTARDAHRARRHARLAESATLRGLAHHHALQTAASSMNVDHGIPHAEAAPTRQSDAWRRMVRETRLSPDALIYPLFVVPGRGVRHAVESMPGISQLSVDEAVKEAKAVAARRARRCSCSPPRRREKDAQGERSARPQGPRCRRPSPPSRTPVRAARVGGRVPVRRDRPRSLRPRARRKARSTTTPPSRHSPRSRSTTRARARMRWRRAT